MRSLIKRKERRSKTFSKKRSKGIKKEKIERKILKKKRERESNGETKRESEIDTVSMPEATHNHNDLNPTHFWRSMNSWCTVPLAQVIH